MASRGPNSFLFGVGSPSGISNASTMRAAFKDKGAFEVRYGSFNSVRRVRRTITRSSLLMRLALFASIWWNDDHHKYKQEPAFNQFRRAYAALL